MKRNKIKTRKVLTAVIVAMFTGISLIAAGVTPADVTE